MTYTLGSLFDGSGGFPLAGTLCGMLIDGTVERDENGVLFYAKSGKPFKVKTKAQMLNWYNKLHTDSAEYKMWGNGIALPPALYCMQGIADALKEVEDDWML